MGLVWTPEALPGVVAHFVAWAAAAWIFFTRPDRAQNRYLALVLGLEGVTVGTGAGWMYITDDPNAVMALQAVGIPFGLALMPAYFLFLSTLPTRFVKPLNHPVSKGLLWAALALMPLLYFLNRRAFIQGYHEGTFSTWDVQFGPAWGLLPMAFLVQALAGLVFTILNYRTAPEGPTKAQAGAYLAAFLLRDVGFVAITSLYIWGQGLLPPGYAGVLFPALVTLLYIAVLTYGILRTQLFGMDLRVKFVIKSGTLAAPFAAAFFLVGEGLEGLVPFNSYWLSLAAAALIALALSPLQRLAQRVADRMLPGVQRTDAYYAHRAQEIYVAALEGAMHDGRISMRERHILDSIRGRLGLEDDAAARIERTFRSAVAV